jgi:catechol 2,3-dioxygenase-like lactoylglutathione lyase family enzyme
MPENGFTHVSIHAHDLDESVRFYTEVFGMEEIPAPDFPFPVRWLRVGDLQLHLFQSDETAPGGHHIGIEVDDFAAAYERVNERGARIKEGYFSKLYELPDGAVQMYLRDPAGNMVEVNWPNIATLDRSVVDEEIEEVDPDADGSKVTLYLRPRS